MAVIGWKPVRRLMNEMLLRPNGRPDPIASRSVIGFCELTRTILGKKQKTDRGMEKINWWNGETSIERRVLLEFDRRLLRSMVDHSTYRTIMVLSISWLYHEGWMIGSQADCD